MATNARGIIPYTPGEPPASTTDPNLARATWEELYRIRQALADIDRPVSVVVLGDDVLAMNQAPTFERLLDETVTVPWEQPPGQFNFTTGVWTCPTEGLYLITPRMACPAVPTPQIKSLTVTLRLTVDYINPATPNLVLTVDDSGLDDSPTVVAGVFLLPLVQGDQLWVDGTLQHPQNVANVTVATRLQIVRQSGIR
jgi:hypothetical protein